MLANRAARLASILRRLMRTAPGVSASAVVTLDGLPMVTAVRDVHDEEHLAALTASLLALGEQATAAFGAGRLAQVAVEGEDGFLFVLRAGPVALVALADGGAGVGLVRFELRETAREIAEAFDAPAAPVHLIDRGVTHAGG
jgi:uncharacterized protein